MKTKVVAVLVGITSTAIMTCVVAYLLSQVMAMAVPSFLYIFLLVIATIQLLIAVGLTKAIIMADLGDA